MPWQNTGRAQLELPEKGCANKQERRKLQRTVLNCSKNYIFQPPTIALHSLS